VPDSILKIGIFRAENALEATDSDPRLQFKTCIRKSFAGAGNQSFTGIFTQLTARLETGLCPGTVHPLLANAARAIACTLITMSETMKPTFGLVRRPRGGGLRKEDHSPACGGKSTDPIWRGQTGKVNSRFAVPFLICRCRACSAIWLVWLVRVAKNPLVLFCR